MTSPVQSMPEIHHLILLTDKSNSKSELLVFMTIYMRPSKTVSILGAVKPIAEIAKPGVDIAGKTVSDELLDKKMR